MEVATLVRDLLAASRRPLTLMDALDAIPDFRLDRRKKYPLREVLAVAACAMVAGAKGPTGARFARSALATSSQCSAANGEMCAVTDR